MNPVSIRPMTRSDREVLLQIVRDTEMFTRAEVDVACELMDVYLDRPGQKDYILAVAVDPADRPLGYVCYGPTPATEFTYDLYWIAVAPAEQRAGIGRALLRYAERACYGSGGRLIIIETSSQEKYEPTRAFYRRNGYEIEARIKNFYAAGDDRLIYTRRFADTMKNESKDR